VNDPGVDLLDLDRWAREGAPHDAFRRLREEAPVWRHPSPTADGPGFWVVSGHEEVVALGRRTDVLSSDQDHGGSTGLGPGDELQRVFDESFAALGVTTETNDAKQLLTLDPPEHTANRKLVNKGFTPKAIGALEPAVREQAAALLDVHRDGAPFDFTVDVAMPLPMQVIGDLLGVDRSRHHDLLRWSNEAVGSTDPEYDAGPGSQLLAALQLAQLFGELREARGAAGVHGDVEDVIGLLVDAALHGEPLSMLRYTMFLLLFTTAGNETTRNAMSHGIWAFADHPEQWQRLRADRSLVPAAVEELVRWASPVLYFRRNALEPVEVAGQTIEAGDLVSLWYVSANRDAAAFDRPDAFDVGRSPNHHVGFGGGGAHFCLGASLARLEIRVLLEEMLDRYERIDVVGPVERLRSNFLHGIKHLPVALRTVV
jgi:cholest-4-en-3-one 26-monooxygenase